MATRQRPSRSRPTTRLGPRTAASTAITAFSAPRSTAPPTSTALNHPHHPQYHNNNNNASRAEVLLATLGTVLVVGVCVAALFLLVRHRRRRGMLANASPSFPPPPPSYSSVWYDKEGLAHGGRGSREREWVNEKGEKGGEKGGKGQEGSDGMVEAVVSPGKCEEGHAGRPMGWPRHGMEMRTGGDDQVHSGGTVGGRGGARSALDRAVGAAQGRLSKLGQRFSTAAAGVSSEEERAPSPLPPPPCLGKDVEAGSASGYASGSEKDGCRIGGQGDGSDAWDEFAARAGAGRVGWLGRYTGAADCLVRKRGSPRQPDGGDGLV